MKRFLFMLLGVVLISSVSVFLASGVGVKRDASSEYTLESSQEFKNERKGLDSDALPDLKDYTVYPFSDTEDMILSNNFRYSVVYPNSWRVSQYYWVTDGMDESIIFHIPTDDWYQVTIDAGRSPEKKGWFDDELSMSENLNFETKCGSGYRYSRGFLRGIASEYFLIKSGEFYLRLGMLYNYASSNGLYVKMFDELVESLNCSV